MKNEAGEPRLRASVQYQWPSRWKAPSMMLLSMLVGVGFGLGHHKYYESFDNQPVRSNDQQQWAVRVGTGLAFLTKTAFTAAVGITFSQYLWVIARRKALTLRSLDAAFTLTSNPASFVDFGVLSRAKLLVILALASWLLPLIALVTPATLTVESRLNGNTTIKPVPYPNFDLTNGHVGTDVSANVWSDYQGVGWPVNASPGLRRLLTAVGSGASVIPVGAPYPNSSYSIQFYGPCLNCQSLDKALKSHDFDNFKQLTADNPSNNSDLSELWDQFGDIKKDSDIYYKATAPWNRNLILVATGPTNTADKTGGVSLTCQLRNASYNVDFVFEQGVPSTTISSFELQPVLNYSTNTKPIPELPPNGLRAYLSMLLALSALLSGRFGWPNGLSSSGMTGGDIDVLTTGLMACPEIIAQPGTSKLPAVSQTFPSHLCRNGSLAAAIEDLSRNFTLSLLSSSAFSEDRPVKVAISYPMNYYSYHPKAVAISYLTGLGVTLACFLIGIWATHSNGHSADTTFSTILHTTRNPQLDDMMKLMDVDGSEGGDGTFERTKLQYGIINQDGDVGHAAFGKADTITRVSRL
ncbi:hypothetical protein DM02DRAFT_690836 [Periconia macrospinosa]|uniref:Uncharacterized protein n=1 Tax=Periconia macrospinosa TaxID=97972 RepID=A0A2V1E2U5_9PLEO|nr:hypothetical protein DM02DRAFT_690836 [Periconia macrospinosa]